MSLETGSFIADLTPTNPISSDPVGQGDDHLRLIKTCLQGTLPNMGSIFGQVRSQDTAVSLSSTWNNNLILSTNSATATVVLTLPPAASITNGFTLRFVTGPGANISLLPSGAASINGAASFAIPERNIAFAVYAGSSVWRAGTSPSGESGSFFSGLTVSGATQLNGTLSVSGATVLASLTVSASTVLNGIAQLNSTLSVSGIATFKSGISVSGVAILNGSVAMNSGLSVSGATHLNTTLSVGGAVALGTTLSVSGAANFAGTVSISGATVHSTTLAVRGAVTFDSTLSVSAAATFGGAMSVSGATHLKTTLSVGGAVQLASTVSVGGATTLGTTLSVSGATVLNNATINGTLTVSAAFTCKSVMSVSGAATFGGAVGITGLLTVSGGQIAFPATQSASADPNTLDDYEEGSWTPSITFDVDAIASLTYGNRAGTYTKVGREVAVHIAVSTVGYDPGASTGNLLISGMPWTPSAPAGASFPGKLDWQGITKAGYTEISFTLVHGTAAIQFIASGSGLGRSNVTVGNTAAGTQLTLNGNCTFSV